MDTGKTHQRGYHTRVALWSFVAVTVVTVVTSGHVYNMMLILFSYMILYHHNIINMMKHGRVLM